MHYAGISVYVNHCLGCMDHLCLLLSLCVQKGNHEVKVVRCVLALFYTEIGSMNSNSKAIACK